MNDSDFKEITPREMTVLANMPVDSAALFDTLAENHREDLLDIAREYLGESVVENLDSRILEQLIDHDQSLTLLVHYPLENSVKQAKREERLKKVVSDLEDERTKVQIVTAKTVRDFKTTREILQKMSSIIDLTTISPFLDPRNYPDYCLSVISNMISNHLRIRIAEPGVRRGLTVNTNMINQEKARTRATLDAYKKLISTRGWNEDEVVALIEELNNQTLNRYTQYSVKELCDAIHQYNSSLNRNQVKVKIQHFMSNYSDELNQVVFSQIGRILPVRFPKDLTAQELEYIKLRNTNTAITGRKRAISLHEIINELYELGLGQMKSPELFISQIKRAHTQGDIPEDSEILDLLQSKKDFLTKSQYDNFITELITQTNSLKTQLNYNDLYLAAFETDEIDNNTRQRLKSFISLYREEINEIILDKTGLGLPIRNPGRLKESELRFLREVVSSEDLQSSSFLISLAKSSRTSVRTLDSFRDNLARYLKDNPDEKLHAIYRLLPKEA